MKTIAAAAGALACLVVTAALPSPSTLFLEELTSPEVMTAIKEGKSTMLVPIGGTEQNGGHMVLGKHNVRARILAGDIAARLGNALVAPVISYVPEGSIHPPTGHMRQAGTISVPQDAFEKVLESAARSFLSHGFSRVVFLGDHGGYQASLYRVARRLNRPGASPVVLVPKEYYREMEHAGREDTALALAVDPALARDAHGARVEAGRALREEIVAATVRSIRQSPAPK